ncbi:MAG: hypothetical protein P4M00_09960 [Azospirillaceae bacterium]|nr:hypothetical protein [Azospirillaceae bacterium]
MRPTGQKPARDWVRFKPGEKPSAVPEKPQDDDEKLLQLLQSAKRELQGLRVVHLHLSLLKDKNSTDTLSIKHAFQEAASTATFLQTYSLSNDDLIILYKGMRFSNVSDICQKVERVILSRTKMTGPNPYNEKALFSVLELSLNFVNVIRFIESLAAKNPGHINSAATKPPITLEELGKIERAMAIFDLSPFILNQPIIDISEEPNLREYYEVYITVRELENRVSPNFDITSNRWLFNYFTSNLDQSTLRSLNYSVEFLRNNRIGLNLNLTTVLSDVFVRFDERLNAELKNNLVIEINKVDLIENEYLFREVIEYAAYKGFRVCIDGLSPYWVAHLDIDNMGCDYAKIFWNADMDSLKEPEKSIFLDKIKNQSSCQYILARCGTVSGLLFAHRHGINLVQGRIVDNILRKGVSISDAIKTAKVMDGD